MTTYLSLWPVAIATASMILRSCAGSLTATLATRSTGCPLARLARDGEHPLGAKVAGSAC